MAHKDEVWPVYKFQQGVWGTREYLYYGTTAQLATDFAIAWNLANNWGNGCYLSSPCHIPAEARINSYRGWDIEFDYGRYIAVHDNYDAEWGGDEDGWVDNGLRLAERRLVDLINEIDLHDASDKVNWITK